MKPLKRVNFHLVQWKAPIYEMELYRDNYEARKRILTKLLNLYMIDSDQLISNTTGFYINGIFQCRRMHQLINILKFN